MNYRNVPNALSLSRIALSFLFAYFFNELFIANLYSSYALFTFVLIIITDYLDGYIARKSNNVSVLGCFLDVMADLLFVFISYLVLSINEKINSIFLIVFLIKFLEFVITSYVMKENTSLVFDKVGMVVSKFWIAFPGIVCFAYTIGITFSSTFSNAILFISSIFALISTIQRIVSYFK